jgi:hypothetical protein
LGQSHRNLTIDRFNPVDHTGGAQITQICAPESTMLAGRDLRHNGGSARILSDLLGHAR